MAMVKPTIKNLSAVVIYASQTGRAKSGSYACAGHYLITAPRVPLTPLCTAGFFLPEIGGAWRHHARRRRWRHRQAGPQRQRLRRCQLFGVREWRAAHYPQGQCRCARDVVRPSATPLGREVLPIGTSRQFEATQHFGRFRSEADIDRAALASRRVKTASSASAFILASDAIAASFVRFSRPG